MTADFSKLQSHNLIENSKGSVFGKQYYNSYRYYIVIHRSLNIKSNPIYLTQLMITF